MQTSHRLLKIKSSQEWVQKKKIGVLSLDPVKDL